MNGSIVFKPVFSPQHGWLHYGMAMVILLVMVLILARIHKPRAVKLDGCQVIEKKHLGNKTVVYIVEYQQQRFLLADNQQGLVMHPVKQGVNDAPL